MSSLWTPEGEHRVPRTADEARTAPPTNEPTPAASGDRHDGDADDGGYSEEEMREVARALLSAPVEDVVANHCYGLFELAALHLSQRPPNLEAARVAVDAMGLLVEGLGDRLGAHGPNLAEGLTQLRLTWVKIADAAKLPPEPGDGAAPAS